MKYRKYINCLQTKTFHLILSSFIIEKRGNPEINRNHPDSYQAILIYLSQLVPAYPLSSHEILWTLITSGEQTLRERLSRYSKKMCQFPFSLPWNGFVDILHRAKRQFTICGLHYGSVFEAFQLLFGLHLTTKKFFNDFDYNRHFTIFLPVGISCNIQLTHVETYQANSHNSPSEAFGVHSENEQC